jgi:hypothetical protein
LRDWKNIAYAKSGKPFQNAFETLESREVTVRPSYCQPNIWTFPIWLYIIIVHSRELHLEVVVLLCLLCARAGAVFFAQLR